MKSDNHVLEVTDLRVSRGGIQVLDIPSFFLRENEFVSLIGPNGCGKSTLLLSIMCLLKREHGTLRYKGEEVASRRAELDYRRRIAMVLQEPLLFDSTVYDNVASGLKIRKVGGQEMKRRVEEYLERFNLSAMAQRSARKLSGGEARRVSLARAFAVEPDVIFFDEPFAHLDTPTRSALIDDMERIIKDTGTAAVLVTHDQGEALRLSDRVVVMNGGRVIQVDAPAHVMNHPVNEFVANFVGMETVLEGAVLTNNNRELAVSVCGAEIDAIGDAAPGETVYCCIRPENVVLQISDRAETSSSRNVFSGRIDDIASMGPFLRLRVDCGFPLTSYITCQAFAELQLKEGTQVFASFKATSVHLIRKGR